MCRRRLARSRTMLILMANSARAELVRDAAEVLKTRVAAWSESGWAREEPPSTVVKNPNEEEAGLNV
jgi:hypothetical protein